MSLKIPPELPKMLQDFTISVLREKPEDLDAFAMNYFTSRYKGVLGNDKMSPANDFKKKGVGFVETTSSDESDDSIAAEPPSRELLMRKRQSVSAERYDPEADEEDDDKNKVVHPKTDEQRARLGDAVKNILLFKSLDQEQRSEVIDAMFERETAEGDCIIAEGDDGDNFYIIESGVYDIFKLIKNENQKVGAYNNSGSFGELALMYNQPRAASIYTSSPGRIWALDRQTFRRIVLKSAYLKREMHEQLIERVPLFSELTAYERMNLADALTTCTFDRGDVIIRQGEAAEGMFFIESGVVKVVLKTGDGEEKEVNQLQSGQYFGELALLAKKARAASVVALADTKCAFLDVEAFERLLGPCRDVMGRNIAEYNKQLEAAFGRAVSVDELR